MNSEAGSLRTVLARLGLIGLRAISFLPLPVLAVAGRGLGRLVYVVHAPRRRVVQINLALCFPALSPAQRTRLARAHFAALGQAVFDSAIAWWGSRQRLERLVTFRDRHYYDQALAAGPVILLVPHFMAMEIGVCLSLERSFANVYRRLPNPVFEAAFRAAIGRFGATMITQEAGVRPVLQALRKGRVLYYLPDQDFGVRQSVFAPFFGVPTSTLDGAGRLARVVGAQVVPCYVWQRPRGQGYEIAFGPPLADFPTPDALGNATCTNAAIENGIRVHPEQYFWVHKRFKTRPPGTPPVY